MEKVKKLNMFYSLENSQGIQVMVNARTTTSVFIPMETISPALTSSSIPTKRASTLTNEVDKLVHVTATLTMEESTLPPVSINRAQDNNQ